MARTGCEAERKEISCFRIVTVLSVFVDVDLVTSDITEGSFMFGLVHLTDAKFDTAVLEPGKGTAVRSLRALLSVRPL